MIFVTVGTHEQPFNRLIKEIDRLKKENYIEDQVIVQTGFGTYEPGSCQWKQFVSCQEMDYELEEEFEQTEAGIWIQKNASLFGFILRYPKGRENITGYAYEPWHIR